MKVPSAFQCIAMLSLINSLLFSITCWAVIDQFFVIFYHMLVSEACKGNHIHRTGNKMRTGIDADILLTRVNILGSVNELV